MSEAPPAYPDTYRDRIIDAALRLAISRPWSEISLRDIAEAANSDLVELRASFSSKADILAAFTRRIDDEVLAQSGHPEKGQLLRDALFEVIMRRLDALQPHRVAIRSIIADIGFSPELIRPTLASQAWMLQAAGINTDGIRGNLRVAGLAALYASVLRTWLKDDDPGLAHTMAVLDRGLRRGESSLATLDSAVSTVRRMGKAFRSALREGRNAIATKESPPPEPEPSPSGSTLSSQPEPH